MMIDLIVQLLAEIYNTTIMIAPYLLMGFLMSGILSVMISVENVAKYLGDNKSYSVFFASLFGVPLPLCSCGVIPVFSFLKKHGANKGAATSFLISTPQTGVDSIAITWIRYETQIPEPGSGLGTGFSDLRPLYPASVVKLFYAVAIEAWLKKDLILSSCKKR